MGQKQVNMNNTQRGGHGGHGQQDYMGKAKNLLEEPV